MTDAGPVARAAELATLGHQAPSPAPTSNGSQHRARRRSRRPRARGRARRAGPRRARRRGRPVAPRDSPTTAAGGAPAGGRARAGVAGRRGRVAPVLVDVLDDPDVTVVEARGVGARRAGRRRGRGRRGRRARATSRATHRDALAREAAVAALGALGDPRRAARRSSPRATTSPRCAGARCWRWRRSTVPRSTPRSPPRSTTATGRSAKPPRTSADDLTRSLASALDHGQSSSSGSTKSSWSRLTCSVHSLPVQYRQWNRPVGSGYQSAGVTGAVDATPPRLTCSVHAVPSQ